MTIVIIAAMPEELGHIHLNLESATQKSIHQLTCYEGEYDGTQVIAVCSGIGKVHAAVAATIAIEHYHPSCIINTGTLGALSNQLAPKTIILSDSVAYHDVDLTAFKHYVHGQIPQQPPIYDASSTLLDIFERLGASTPDNVQIGLTVTGDQFVASNTQLEQIKSNFPDAIGIEMEAAAIAHTARLFDVPFISVRAISDHADEQSTAAFDENLVNAAQTVGNFVLSAIPSIQTHQDPFKTSG